MKNYLLVLCLSSASLFARPVTEVQGVPAEIYQVCGSLLPSSTGDTLIAEEDTIGFNSRPPGVFIGMAICHIDDYSYCNRAEERWLRGRAERFTHGLCRQAGLIDCRVIGSRITDNYPYGCEAQAKVRGRQPGKFL